MQKFIYEQMNVTKLIRHIFRIKPLWVSLFLRDLDKSLFLLNSTLKAEKAIAPHSSTLACKIPWTEEPGGLKFHGVTKEWDMSEHAHTHTHTHTHTHPL